MEAGDETRHPTEEDAALEATVLQQLLALHPVQLTLSELRRELSGDSREFALTDAIDRAVRELTAAGLLHRHGEVVLPSRAALRFEQLIE